MSRILSEVEEEIVNREILIEAKAAIWISECAAPAVIFTSSMSLNLGPNVTSS